ncbi:MAG: RagB/SusD family nutrient uptake outer membrane protein [Pigmentiphaga sp.]|nr:RagB/SusD family nutrient uptake outer membrane protein [Pigmentiphaga sp.]
MKKYWNSIIILIVVILVTNIGCTETSEGFLDAKEETETLETIFSDSLKTMQFQASIFWKIPDVIMGPRRPGNGFYLQSFKDYDSATDNMREKNNSDRTEFGPAFTKADFTQDGINANFNKFLNSWTAMYQNIRVCSQFLENYERSPLSEAKKTKLVAETRFMRAFYYFHLLRNFGGVPLVGDAMLNPFEDQGIPRSTFEQTVDFIANELEYAIDNLPDEQIGNDYGRPTIGSAMAVLAKLYFYVASPLYNGGNIGTGENRAMVGYEDYDVSRWQKAKDAIDNFLNYNTSVGELYGLIENEYIDDGEGNDILTIENSGYYKSTTRRVSKERIWYWITYHGHTWPHEQLLPGSRSGVAAVLPYHGLTEAFPTKDGVEIRPRINGEYVTMPGQYNESNALYDPRNPYENRDPRFYIAFLFNEAKWPKSAGEAPQPVYTYRGAAQDGIFTGSTSTGYYFAKLCVRSALGRSMGVTVSGQGEAFIRYADILLMDAEIMTELDVDANRTEIEKHLFTIRERAGIEPGANNRYGIPENMNKDEMIAFIINERRIEFVLEGGNRFWDLKRRKLFENLNEKWSYAAVWEKAGEDSDGQPIYSWSAQQIEQHFFNQRMYHFPIPLKEIEASHGTLIQNPGW